ncbi:hypothetical protein D4764_02G0004890 [Takifugu flavidus]|uniref:Uncharacterized protein n=1 Tax=Takifugu flavidus TaxID=433684 RepID=A0A5C6NL35_9TELE|nr:hypothetical protein D4764_02G0004890 [Takifugu flavidus]
MRLLLCSAGVAGSSSNSSNFCRNTRPTFATIRIANAGAGRFGPEEDVDQTGGGTCRMDRCVSAVCQRAE